MTPRRQFQGSKTIAPNGKKRASERAALRGNSPATVDLRSLGLCQRFRQRKPFED
jgi:hypothetical protein